MADALVINAVVSSMVEGILGRLGSVTFKEISQILGVKHKLKRLEKSLCAIEGVLLDAEQQQSTNESVKNWLRNLKDVAYDIDDVLDAISTRHLERQLNPRNFLWTTMTKMFSRWDLAQELKLICCRLEEIADDRSNYSFQENCSRPPTFDGYSSERETYSFVQDSRVFGRKRDKEWIVNRLLYSLSHDVEHPHPCVVPIIGIGGMGKTTLAQLVINDARVVQGFELRLWAYISKRFDMKTVILNIIQSAAGEDCSYMNLEALQKKLRSSLDGKLFLLVLDDVWIEDSKQWLQLKELLAVGATRSTIIVTTREERVAALTGTTKPYELRELSEEDSWSIFVEFVFNEGEEEAFPLLVQIGKSIIRKCKGVPLAVKTLGSLLRHERHYHNWKRIEESELWRILQGPNDIMPALKLSFDHIPQNLRACFASCAMFGKGYPLYRSDLIGLWMAQGFLQFGDQGSEDSIDVGYKFFNELMSRSFFQLPGYSITKQHAMFLAEDFNWMQGWVNHSQMCNEDAISQGFRTCDGSIKCVEMHDLVHDLASYVAGEETTVVNSNSDKISSRVKHLVWDMDDLPGKDFPKALLEARKARTFAFTFSFLYRVAFIWKSFLSSLISNFRCLRVLMFVYSEFEELPESIGNLKHLRYLSLHGNSQLKSLPNSICKLVNLKVMDVGDCTNLQMLPEQLHRLVSLRILWLTFVCSSLPERAHQGWFRLQVLKITYCPNLVSLSKQLEIGSLKSLKVLIIRVCNSLVQLPDSLIILANLEHLMIHSCRELDLTKWKGLRNLSSLRILIIYNLPKLLEFPDIVSASATLQYLRISNCASLCSLPDSLAHCTSLLKLQVFDCPMLSFLPRKINCLKSVQELRILGCPELRRRCEREGEDWDLISHIPNIYIDEMVIQTRQHPSNMP